MHIKRTLSKTLFFSIFVFGFILFLSPAYSSNFWQNFYIQFYGNLFPENSLLITDNSGKIILGEYNPTPRTVTNWKSALETTNYKGISWIGKLESNGFNDDVKREDKGRDTIVYAPYTDFSKPVDIIYYFHGIHGFCDMENNIKNSCTISDMKERVIFQSDILVNNGRNIVIVFPELPWSAGTASDDSRRKGRQSNFIWTSKDSSDLLQLHNDVLDIIKTKFNSNKNIQINNIEMTGHSAGGAAIAMASRYPTPENNYLMKIKPNILKMSDGDYCAFGRNATTDIYQNYVKNNDATLYLLVQDPSLGSAHEPTGSAILFYNDITTQNCNKSKDVKHKAPKLPINSENFVPNTNNKVVYIPLNLGHKEIGKMSLAYYISNHKAYTPNIVKTDSELLFPLTLGSFKYISYNFTQIRKETDSIPYKRCHGGIDIYTKEKAEVQAIADGVIINLNKSFVRCGPENNKKYGTAIYVYHPSIDKTIMYGEINDSHIAKNPRTNKEWKANDAVKKGDILGKASICGMLHFELHEGKRDALGWMADSGSWKLNGKHSYDNCMKTKPQNLLDPKDFLNSILNSKQNQQYAAIQRAYEKKG